MKKLNHKGIGLPTVLALSSFLIALSVSLISYVVFQANVVEFSIQKSENYINAETKLRSTLDALSKQETLDDSIIDQITSDFEVTLEKVSLNLYKISSRLNENNLLESYFTTSAKKTNTYETIFYYTGQETTFKLDPIITANSMLVSRYNEIFTPLDSSYLLNNSATFTQVMNKVEAYAAVNAYDNVIVLTPQQLLNTASRNTISITNQIVFVTGSVILGERNLIVDSNAVLYIDGNLSYGLKNNKASVALDLQGEIVVNGFVEVPEKVKMSITLYSNGNFSTSKDVNLGTAVRPSFVFSNAIIDLDNKSSGYGYFLSDSFNSQQGNIYITGGVYYHTSVDLNKDVKENTALTDSILSDSKIPIYIETTSETTGGDFVYTFPKLRN
ncbi:MAG: hypothetical protein RBQ95_00285 [Paracholeplasma sp.]|nr:hypothetical protein [Paracholeplasma sp.]MDY3195271.1 hypothetical protein [Paracholeplasma sp.]